MSRDELVEIAGEVRRESELAWLFFDGDREVWLPKSRCEWDEGSGTMNVPEWLANKLGLI